jgi:phosphoribosyl 1,2-cyclic phosphodiesterase
MEFVALQSGSNGNCVYVQAGEVRLLVDAGISGIQAQQRLAGAGFDITAVDAVLISHDHSDHARSLGIFQRKFRLPVYVTRATLRAASYQGLGRLGDVRHFRAGEVLQFGGLRVETLPTPHDGADGVVFVFDDGHQRLGIMTDLGHPFAELAPAIASLDAVLLESNYDPQMLAAGRYPASLKQRIRGPGGHLSNLEAAELLCRAAGSRLRWACLGHLSEENNCPQLAFQTHRQVLGDRFPLHVASRYAAGDLLRV